MPGLNTKKDGQKFSLSGTFKTGREYIDTRLKLFQLKLTERASRLLASLLVDVIKLVLVLFVVFFFSLALGFYFSELLGNTALGFLTTGGIFLLLVFVLSAFEIRLERLLMNLSIKRFLQKWHDEIEEDDELGPAVTDPTEKMGENEIQGK